MTIAGARGRTAVLTARHCGLRDGFCVAVTSVVHACVHVEDVE